MKKICPVAHYARFSIQSIETASWLKVCGYLPSSRPGSYRRTWSPLRWSSWSRYRVPHIVFRFFTSILIEGRAIICMKSCLPALSIGKQFEAHHIFIRLGKYQWRFLQNPFQRIFVEFNACINVGRILDLTNLKTFKI